MLGDILRAIFWSPPRWSDLGIPLYVATLGQYVQLVRWGLGNDKPLRLDYLRLGVAALGVRIGAGMLYCGVCAWQTMHDLVLCDVVTRVIDHNVLFPAEMPFSSELPAGPEYTAELSLSAAAHALGTMLRGSQMYYDGYVTRVMAPVDGVPAELFRVTSPAASNTRYIYLAGECLEMVRRWAN